MTTDPATVYVDGVDPDMADIRALHAETQAEAAAGVRTENGFRVSADQPDLFGDPLFAAISDNWSGGTAPSASTYGGRTALRFNGAQAWTRAFALAEFGGAATMSFLATIAYKAATSGARILVLQYSATDGAPDNVASEISGTRATISLDDAEITTQTTERTGEIAIHASTVIVRVYIDPKADCRLSEIQLAAGPDGWRSPMIGSGGAIRPPVKALDTFTGGGTIGVARLASGGAASAEAAISARFTGVTPQTRRAAHGVSAAAITGLHAWWQPERVETSGGFVDRLRDAGQRGQHLAPIDGSAVRGGPGFLAFDGASTLATEKPETSLAFQDYVILPDGVNPPATGGFTVTGWRRITSGTYAGCWLAGDDGRDLVSGASGWTPAVYIISPDRKQILKTIDVSTDLTITNQTIQGAEWDETDDSIWVAMYDSTPTVRRVLHLSLDANYDATIVSADTIDYVTLGYAGTPNGLARIPAADALIVSDSNTTTIRIFDCDGTASPRLLKTFTGPSGVDLLHYDETEGRLYMSGGASGTDGWIKYFEMDGVSGPSFNQVKTLATGLTYAQAIEGIQIDRAAGLVYAANDGGGHVADGPVPPLNCVITYKAVFPLARVTSETATVGFFVEAADSTPSGSGAIVAFRDYSNGGVFVGQNTANQLRVIIQSGDASDLFVVNFDDTMTDAGFYSVAIDLGGGTIAAYKDGVALTGTVSTGDIASMTNPLDLTEISIGGIENGPDGTIEAPFEGRVSDVIVSTAITTDARERIEAVLAWLNGAAASLPGAHTYASAPPTS